MTAIEIIERALESKVIKNSLTYVPDRGATSEELSILSKDLPRFLSESHLSILKKWNGINLDMVRLYGASPSQELRGLSETQYGPLLYFPDAIIFGDDPSGFVYAERSDGKIFALDSSSGGIEIVATSLDDFFTRLVFGEDADQFAGDEWLSEVKRAGLA